MTRYVIATEGVLDKPFGRFIEPGALWWKDEPLPVAYAYDFNDRPMGTATEIQRNEVTGEISAEIILDEKYSALKDDLKSFGYYLMGVESTTDDEVLIITKAQLRAIGSEGLNSGFPSDNVKLMDNEAWRDVPITAGDIYDMLNGWTNVYRPTVQAIREGIQKVAESKL